MKPLFLIISILFFSTNVFSQQYRKLVDSTNKWNYVDEYMTTNGNGESKTNALFISGDTIIESIHYKRLMSKIIRVFDTTIVFAAGIREDTIQQTVFLRPPYGSEELLYSFDHLAGDTISIDTNYFGDGCTIRYVKSTSTYNINGFSGKKIEICDTLFRLNVPNPPEEVYADFWYEGIGSFTSVFNLYDIGNLLIFEAELLCYWNNGDFIYQNPDWTVCEYAIITSIDDKLTQDLKIYPNPTTGGLKIDTPAKIKEVCLTNMYGKAVFYSSFTDIDISNLGNGIYLLKIMTETNEIITRKVIKIN